jgi:hypothetical protein
MTVTEAEAAHVERTSPMLSEAARPRVHTQTHTLCRMAAGPMADNIEELSLMPLVNAHTLAAEIDLHVVTIRKLAREGRIPVYSIGRTLKFDPAEVRAALRVTSDETEPAADRSSWVEPDFAALEKEHVA